MLEKIIGHLCEKKIRDFAHLAQEVKKTQSLLDFGNLDCPVERMKAGQLLREITKIADHYGLRIVISIETEDK